MSICTGEKKRMSMALKVGGDQPRALPKTTATGPGSAIAPPKKPAAKPYGMVVATLANFASSEAAISSL